MTVSWNVTRALLSTTSEGSSHTTQISRKVNTGQHQKEEFITFDFLFISTFGLLVNHFMYYLSSDEEIVLY